MQITGIILSGGLSKRMGTDKALLKLNQTTLMENAIKICQKTCEKILISSDNPAHQKFGYPTITDVYKNCGPLSGIYSGLEKSETEWNFVLSVDAAFVEPDFIKELSKNTFKFDAVIPIHNNGKEPLVSMFNKSAIPVIKNHLETGNLRLHNLINNINCKLFNSQDWVEKYPRIFHNLNSPGDIKIVSK